MIFDPKEHRYSTPFNGKPGNAFNVARTALLSLGFEILVDSDSELEAQGPGMQSNRQPELLGVSLLQLNISSSDINARAILGGVAKMKTFVYLFPPGLVLALFAIHYFLGITENSWLYLLLVLPWVLIAPLIGRSLERKTTRAVDRLVRGMAQARSSG